MSKQKPGKASAKKGQKPRKGTDDVYDKAGKTIAQDGRHLLIPLINYMFGRRYTDQARVRMARTESVRRDSTGRHRQFADIHIFISECGTEEEYIIEIQTHPDGKIYERLFRLMMSAAAENFRIDNAEGRVSLCAPLPEAGIIYLRPPRNLKSPIELGIPGHDGQNMSRFLPVVRLDAMELETIFDKDLFFLIPFYMFRYADELADIEKDPARVAALMDQYKEITAYINASHNEGKLSKSDAEMLAVLTEEVTNQLAERMPAIRKGVQDLMDAGVLAWRPEDIRKQAREEGIKAGRADGIKDTEDKLIERMIRMGDDDERIQSMLPDVDADRVAALRERLARAR